MRKFEEAETSKSLLGVSWGSRRPLGDPEHVLKPNGRRVWEVAVECNACARRMSVLLDNLRSGKSTNCKCQGSRKHGQTKGAFNNNLAAQRLGERHDAMHQRCNNPKNANYANYGGRGIKLLFANRDELIEWGLSKFSADDILTLQLDRIDNDGHYEPTNLQLATAAENQRHKRNSQTISYRGRRVNSVDLWDLLKFDNPAFSVGRWRVAKFVAQKLSPAEILLRSGRPRKQSKTRQVPCTEVLKRYGYLVPPGTVLIPTGLGGWMWLRQRPPNSCST